MTALNEYGIKIGTSVTAYEGAVLIDNVRVIKVTETAADAGGGNDTSVSTEPVEAEVTAITSVTMQQATVAIYDKVELIADIDAVFNNPYDPIDIRVDGRFTSPSGTTVVVPGFYYRDFQYGGAGTSLRPTEEWSWRVRFTPTEAGDWSYWIIATTAKGSKRSTKGTFTTSPSDKPGFIRVDSRNSRYFIFDNGTPFFPVGENIGWSNGSDPINDYATWFGAVSAAGGNYARVWMAPWGFSPEWIDTGLGNYDKRQAQAYQLDRVFDLAAENNIYIMLSLLNHGQYSETTNPEWDENPFNAKNGGPLATPADFATNPEALRLWNQRLRYIAARWGYSTNLMTWEWWNEINWTALVNPDLLIPWIERSAAYLGSLDPYHHLITHSGSLEGDEGVWSLDSLSFTQDHKYDLTDLPASYRQSIPEWLSLYPDKPFMMGEFGSPLEVDTQGVLFHLGLWSAPMNGAAGTGMMWWWDTYVQPLNMYYQLTGVNAFFKDEPMGAQVWQPTGAQINEEANDETNARVYGLQSDNSALLWVVNRDYSNQYVQQEYTSALRKSLRERKNGILTYSFEDGDDGWKLSPDWAGGKSVAQSSDQANDDASSLGLTATYTGGSWQEAGVSIQPAGGVDWSGYETVSVDIYLPTGDTVTDFITQVFTKTGADWAWTNSADTALVPGEWTTVTVPLDGLGDLSAINEFGVKIGTSTGVLDGTIYIDNVRLRQGEQTVTIDFPAIESAAVTVPGLPDGDYTVEFWDTINGTVIDTVTQTSAGGVLALTLPSFTTDLAIKVKPV
jgi:hypothetical protein